MGEEWNYRTWLFYGLDKQQYKQQQKLKKYL